MRGVRGIRFTQFDPNTATTTMDMIEPLAQRVQPLGWHVQIHLRADQIVRPPTCCGACRARSCSTISAPDPAGVEPSGLAIIRRMLDSGAPG
jgi:hypothetical protein